VVEEALRLHAEGDTRLPSKSALLWSDELGSEETDGRIMAMPAYVGGSIALAGPEVDPERALEPVARAAARDRVDRAHAIPRRSARRGDGRHDRLGRPDRAP
jgi:hypothetical protein